MVAFRSLKLVDALKNMCEKDASCNSMYFCVRFVDQKPKCINILWRKQSHSQIVFPDNDKDHSNSK